MPYIAIKSFPKDEDTKRKTIEKINEAFLEIWGCPQDAITISIEEIAPKDWDEAVTKSQINPNMAKMQILCGEKKYKVEGL